MGAVPGWYRVVKAAQYLGVAPWDLEQRPARYMRMAEEARKAEAYAASVQQNRTN